MERDYMKDFISSKGDTEVIVDLISSFTQETDMYAHQLFYMAKEFPVEFYNTLNNLDSNNAKAMWHILNLELDGIFREEFFGADTKDFIKEYGYNSLHTQMYRVIHKKVGDPFSTW